MNSPAAIAHPYRRHVSQSAQLTAQVTRIDHTFAALEALLAYKQASSSLTRQRQPFITGFKSISVLHVRSDADVWTIVN
jgi:hypothetical protein